MLLSWWSFLCWTVCCLPLLYYLQHCLRLLLLPPVLQLLPGALPRLLLLPDVLLRLFLLPQRLLLLLRLQSLPESAGSLRSALPGLRCTVQPCHSGLQSGSRSHRKRLSSARAFPRGTAAVLPALPRWLPGLLSRLRADCCNPLPAVPDPCTPAGTLCRICIISGCTQPGSGCCLNLFLPESVLPSRCLRRFHRGI